MNPFEMVIGIVLIVTIGSIVRAKYGVRRDHRGGEYSVDTAGTDAETKAPKVENRALKERIQVLDRIDTDSHHTAAPDQEIEKRREPTRTHGGRGMRV